MSPRDSRHNEARDFFRTITRDTRLVTSNYVISESITWLTYRGFRRQALSLYSMIESAIRTNLLTMEWIGSDLHEQAWSIYERFHDQVLSFCDCTSFAVCQARNVDFVFGFDRDFEIAGFDIRP